MVPILKGDISFTDNIDFVKDIISDPLPNVTIVSVEEIATIPLNAPNVIPGAVLLPPIDGMIAAADNDEPLFDEIYFFHYNTPTVIEFVNVLITYLYRGGSLILFYPEDELGIKSKLIDMFIKRYGILIGEISIRPCQFDIRYTPIWLESTLLTNSIDPIELLYLYPKEAKLEDRLIYRLIMELAPVGETYQQQVDYILHLRDALKINRNLIIPFVSVKGVSM